MGIYLFFPLSCLLLRWFWVSLLYLILLILISVSNFELLGGFGVRTLNPNIFVLSEGRGVSSRRRLFRLNRKRTTALGILFVQSRTVVKVILLIILI